MALQLIISILHEHDETKKIEGKSTMHVHIHGKTPENSTSCQHEVEVAMQLRHMVECWERGMILISVAPKFEEQIKAFVKTLDLPVVDESLAVMQPAGDSPFKQVFEQLNKQEDEQIAARIIPPINKKLH